MSYEATGQTHRCSSQDRQTSGTPRVAAPAALQLVIKRTRTGGVWAASALSALVLVLLLIFVLANGQGLNIG
jgi:uncharacterized integral membrane protein